VKRFVWLPIVASLPLLNGQVIRVQTREVVVDVTVADSRNVPVRDLEKKDFTILDEGKPRVIDGFEVIQSQPPISAMPATPLHMAAEVANAANGNAAPKSGHNTAIILDEVNSFFEDAARARQDIVNLMAKLPTDERIALYVMVRRKGLALVQDYTTDREAIKSNLAKLYPTGLRPIPSFGADQPSPPYYRKPENKDEAEMIWRENVESARTSLQTLAEQLALVPGRKSIFWVTNAFPPRFIHEDFPESWEKTVAALNEADVAVNTVDSRGLYGGSGPNQVTGTVASMRYVSDGTGGEVFFNRNFVDGPIAEGIAASRTTYSLRFHLADDERDNKFHALKVKVDRSGLQVYHRQGYYAGGSETPPDLVAGKIAGQSLETRAASADAGTLDAAVQLPYFYTGTNRASVHLSLDIVPIGIAFQKSATGLRGQIEVVGIASRPDGSEAARFADTVNVDQEDQEHADSFARAPWHYEHQFTVPAGSYVFRLEVGAGPNAVGKKEAPLQIEPWSSASFGIGGIALSTETHQAGGPAPPGALIAGGKEFVPAATNGFRKSERVYFYTEVYEPTLSSSNPSALTMQVRVLDQRTGEVRQDTGMAGVGGYVHPGNPVVPFATALPITQLPPGSYRLEVRAAHSSGPDVVARAIDFDVN
jgi:VWFA-related protein